MEATSTTAATATRSAALDVPALAAFAFGAVLVGWVAADDGGWWPETWAWTALVTLGASVVILLVRDRPLGWLDYGFLGALVAVGVWTALSALWSPSVPSTLDEAQRVLAYVGSGLLALLVVDKRTVRHLLGGVLTAIVLIGTYALGSRLLPDRIGDFDSSNFGNYRLSAPVTYWNGLAIFVVIGVFLAVGVAARGRALWTRALAAATLPILTTTIYFTFSRGAWIALVLGVIAAVALDPRRLQLLAVSLAIAPFSAIAVWLATRADGLRTVDSTLAQATEDGHALVWPLVALAAGSALVAAGMGLAERRVQVPAAARVAFVAVVLAVLVGLVSAAWTEWGSPVAIADRVWEDFRAPGGPGGSSDLGDRLFDFSANGRVETWRVAWDEWQANPTVGAGAGTYWQSWAAARPIGLEVRDAHSLYIETLGELGVIGLALLILALLVPVVAAVRARSTAIVPVAFGGYVAWLAHAGVDWDWELLGVTLPALLVGVALVAAARQPGSRSLGASLAPAGGCGAADRSGGIRRADVRTTRQCSRGARRGAGGTGGRRRPRGQALCALGISPLADPRRRPGRARSGRSASCLSRSARAGRLELGALACTRGDLDRRGAARGARPRRRAESAFARRECPSRRNRAIRLRRVASGRV